MHEKRVITQAQLQPDYVQETALYSILTHQLIIIIIIFVI